MTRPANVLRNTVLALGMAGLWACAAGAPAGTDGDDDIDIIELSDDAPDEAPDESDLEAGDDAETDPADGPQDDAGPVIRSLRVSIAAPYVTELDVSAASAQVIITAGEASVTFVALATDAATPAGQLNPALYAWPDTGHPLSGVTAVLHNGLWRVTGTLQPGQTLAFAITDADGHRTLHPFMLENLTARQALTGRWERRFFNDDEQITSRWTTVFSTGDTWEEQRETGTAGEPFVRGGVFAVTGGLAILEETHNNGLWEGATADLDTSTVEERRSWPLYVDAVYFDPAPYAPKGDTDGVVGQWESSYTQDLPQAVTVTRLLTLRGDGSFTATQTTDPAGGQAGPSAQTTRSGAYRVEPNGSYSENYGDFLHFTTTEADGVTLAQPELTCRMFRLRFGKLLLDFSIRASDPD